MRHSRMGQEAGDAGGQRAAPPPRSLRERITDRVRDALQRLPYSEALFGHHSGGQRDATTATRNLIATDDSVALTPAGSTPALPDRDDLFTEQSQDRAAEHSVDLHGERAADRLTVEDPDNPDATIESDTWVPVER